MYVALEDYAALHLGDIGQMCYYFDIILNCPNSIIKCHQLISCTMAQFMSL